MSGTRRFRCNVCGYVHEGPEPPETCPVCGVGREMFSAEEDEEEETEKPGHPTSQPPRVWRCTVCGHIHEGPEPPEICPVCSVGAELFVPEGDQPPPVQVQTSTERIVIVGGGGAGLTAAEYARRYCSARIQLINKETFVPYNRLNLTRYLAGKVAEGDLWLKPERWYKEQQIELLHGEVVSIDRDARRVILRGDQHLAYDRLILANGAHPFIPPIVGASRDGVTAVRTLAHAKSVLDNAHRGSRAVVVGGGLLGLEAAAALNGHGVQVTVLEGFDSLLPRQLSAPAGDMLRAHLEQLGIAVRCSVKVTELFGDERVSGVRLADGTEFAADQVLLAAGIRPNKYLALQAGLTANSGVVVDDEMRTSDPSIFAAGDIAEHRGVVYGLWPVALGQGAVAGANAAGQKSTFFGTPPANQLKVLDLGVLSIGVFNPTDAAYQVFEHRSAGRYRRLVARDGVLVGANLLGDLSLAGPLKMALETRLHLNRLPAELRSLPELARATNG